MDYNTIFVGMDVHKENFSLCCYSIENDEFSHAHTTAADYKHVLAYIASLRAHSVKMRLSYAVMRLAALGLLYIIS